LPRSSDELTDAITGAGFSEQDAVETLALQETLSLVKVERAPEYDEQALYYNEHAFASAPGKIAKAIRSLDSGRRQDVSDILERVEQRPGYPLSRLASMPQDVVNLMEGVGLLDATQVRSEHAEEVFFTSPQLKGISIDKAPLSADVFHKAKLLLASLRFGELKSASWRGSIATYEKMLNIVNKLLRNEWVGPCTAIGQDYRLLESDGVVATRPATSGWQTKYDMFEMRLRQKEVGVLVKQMLEFGRVVPEANPDLSVILAQEPVVSYEIPEKRRQAILARQTAPVAAIRQRFLQTLRSGLGEDEI
jgi:hypothetical protein